MYRHILLAVALQQWEAFSAHALAAREVAVALAKGAGARLSVLSVYTYDLQTLQTLPPSMEMEMASPYEMEVMRQLETVRSVQEDHIRHLDVTMEEKMRAFLAGVPFPDVAITPVLKEGEPRALIIHMAETLGTDLIVIGAHSKRSFLDVLLGGTAAYVSRHAPCPVIMVHPREQRLTVQPSEVGESLQATQTVQPA
jgi:nucleotide-binding universal stress UspA family protein